MTSKNVKCYLCGGDGWFQLGHYHGDAQQRCIACLGGGSFPIAWWRKLFVRIGILADVKFKRNW